MENTKIRIGIFFGGPSREREVSFAGGRTVYDNLDKSLFVPVPIFVDSLGALILIDWPWVYKGTIRDFYPNAQSGSKFSHYIESLVHSGKCSHEDEIAAIGRKIEYKDLQNEIDVAFLALHGKFGEDGTIQALLSHQGIPFTGSGVLASSIGINKYVQKDLMRVANFTMPSMLVFSKNQWLSDQEACISQISKSFPAKIVIRPAHQGSSIGVSILEDPSEMDIEKAMNLAFFREQWTGAQWKSLSDEEREGWLKNLPDVKAGLGLPLQIGSTTFYTVESVKDFLDQLSADQDVVLQSLDDEAVVIVEEFIEGREFSCIVVRDIEGHVLALPPTEIVKAGHLYDYRSKYLPGFSRKETPISLEDRDLKKIMEECERLFIFLQFDCYARIDGFFTPSGEVILNDPNTTSGMLPSSFFFHQAAEIGLSPSQFLTFIIHSSLYERKRSINAYPKVNDVINKLEKGLKALYNDQDDRQSIAVIFGGYSYERHISVESGRNIFEKLSSSDKYRPVPLFLMKEEEGFSLVQIPIHLLLKDNADDIAKGIQNYKVHPVVTEIRNEAKSITKMYAENSVHPPQVIDWASLKDRFSTVFIALHGRPGEDGALQRKLDALNISYNGSPAAVSAITINKFDTLQLLGSQGFLVAEQLVLEGADYTEDSERWMDSIEGKFEYPFIAKPLDDGCSSAVMKIKDREHLKTYLEGLLRLEDHLSSEIRTKLGLKWNEEFPVKSRVLIEEMITAQGAEHFLEITCGVMSTIVDGRPELLVFEPSEAIANTEILSLEEKFLAGQGLNITPARLSTGNWSYEHIVKKVKADLKRASELIGLQGYARIDAFVRIHADGNVDTIIIEINSLPGMTPATCIYHQAAIEGLKPFDFIDKIITFAQESKQTPALWG